MSKISSCLICSVVVYTEISPITICSKQKVGIEQHYRKATSKINTIIVVFQVKNIEICACTLLLNT